MAARYWLFRIELYFKDWDLLGYREDEQRDTASQY